MNKYFAIIMSSLLLWLMLPAIVYTADGPAPQAQVTDSSTEAEILIGKLWRQSFEEEKQESKVLIFRTNDSIVFPPSRFRMSYRFMKDGQCEWYYLSPDDNHRFKQGKWSINANDKSLLSIATDTGVRAYKIINISKGMMEIMELK